MKKVACIFLSCLCTIALSAQVKAPAMAVKSLAASKGGSPKNVNGTNKIVYLDNHSVQSTGVATVHSAGIVQWTQADNKGVLSEGGKFYESLSYLGDNGKNYQAQIVATESKDPKKKFDVHFQGRPYGEGDYKEGHVIVLDWDKNPWLVTVDYSPLKGILFTFAPYKKES